MNRLGRVAAGLLDAARLLLELGRAVCGVDPTYPARPADAPPPLPTPRLAAPEPERSGPTPYPRPERRPCPGPLVWHDVPATDRLPPSAVLSCTACSYVTVAGQAHDDRHTHTELSRSTP